MGRKDIQSDMTIYAVFISDRYRVCIKSEYVVVKEENFQNSTARPKEQLSFNAVRVTDRVFDATEYLM